MGRILLLILIIVAVILLWKAFGPGTWNRNKPPAEQPSIKGPDDDEEFLWRLEKDAFKQRREKEAQERAARDEKERRRRREERGEPPEA